MTKNTFHHLVLNLLWKNTDTGKNVHQDASDCKTAVDIHMTFIAMKSNLPLYSLTKSKCLYFMFLLITFKNIKTFARHK